jgi:hypothetical protein
MTKPSPVRSNVPELAVFVPPAVSSPCCGKFSCSSRLWALLLPLHLSPRRRTVQKEIYCHGPAPARDANLPARGANPHPTRSVRRACTPATAGRCRSRTAHVIGPVRLRWAGGVWTESRVRFAEGNLWRLGQFVNGGPDVPQTAGVLGVSTATASREAWRASGRLRATHVTRWWRPAQTDSPD